MERLHPLIVQGFPAILTSRGGFTCQLVDLLLDSAAKFKGFADVAQRLRREQALRHSMGESAWLEACAALADVPQIAVRACCPSCCARSRGCRAGASGVADARLRPSCAQAEAQQFQATLERQRLSARLRASGGRDLSDFYRPLPQPLPPLDDALLAQFSTPAPAAAAASPAVPPAPAQPPRFPSFDDVYPAAVAPATLASILVAAVRVLRPYLLGVIVDSYPRILKIDDNFKWNVNDLRAKVTTIGLAMRAGAHASVAAGAARHRRRPWRD